MFMAGTCVRRCPHRRKGISLSLPKITKYFRNIQKNQKKYLLQIKMASYGTDVQFFL